MSDGSQRRRRAVVIAYACRPGWGSEPAAGWGVVMALNEFLDPIVLTPPEYLEPSREYLADRPEPHPEFVAVPEPWWGPWALHANRFFAFFSYLGWLRRANVVAKRLVAEGDIDVAIHVTYSPYWLPTPIRDLPIPSIWGPIGGGVVTPRPLHRFLGLQGRFVEWFDFVVVRLLDRLPATRRSWREVTLRLVQNYETLARLRTETDRPAIIFNHGVVHDFTYESSPRRGEPYVVWLSKVESRKGLELAIRAMARATTEAPMRIVGDGPDRPRMERLVAELGIEDRIEFLGNVPHEEAIELIAHASVAVYTGMREEGGMALAEGLLTGTPTILLDNGGPAVMAEAVSDPDRIVAVDTSSAEGALSAIAEAIDHFTSFEADRSKPLLDRPEMVRQLAAIVDRVFVDDRPELIVPYDDAAERSGEPPLVSVVMPAYNAAPYLAEAMHSVLDQTLDDFELIVVENGSTDETREIAQRIAKADPRVRLYTSDVRLGVVEPAAEGVRLARGDLIARLDADDVADPTRLARQVEVLREHPEVAVVGSAAHHIGIDGSLLGMTNAGPATVEEFRGLRDGGEITMVLDGTAMFRRDAYEAAGGYDARFPSAAEVDLHCRMAAHGAIVSIPEPLIRYRLHGSSAVDSDFFAGRRVHRYVAYREAARAAGRKPIGFEEYVASNELAGTRERFVHWMGDRARYQYRAAGTAYGRGRKAAAAVHVVRAALFSPKLVVDRVWTRRWSRSARRIIETGS